MDNYFGKYELSEKTLEKLQSIKEAIKDDISHADPKWGTLITKEEESINTDSEESNDSVKSLDEKVPDMESNQSILSTQFFFTQSERDQERNSTETFSDIKDIIESVYEGLERSKGRLDITYLDNVSNEDLLEIINYLGSRLTPKGIYNLCCSLIDMDIEQRMRYMNVFCTHLLVPKIIAIEEPSRLITSAIGELVGKFPDDALTLIFIPLLNVDLKDTTVVNALVKTHDDSRKTVLLSEFVAHAKEIKAWHIPILQILLSSKTDKKVNSKIVKLFAEKTLAFSKDKTFGKLMLSFIKMNKDFSEEEVQLLREIVTVNETVFKRSLENTLKNM